eukprot:g55850.t1
MYTTGTKNLDLKKNLDRRPKNLENLKKSISRIFTIFVYLNDLPEGEGLTVFPVLGLSCQPRQGTAILFRNISPLRWPDGRVVHRADPVSEGLTKYDVNIWVTEANFCHAA